jgi:hypothetical protein
VLLQVVRLCDLLDACSCLRKLDAALEAEAMREQDWTGDWDWFVSLLVAAERWRQQCPMFFGAALARGGSELCSFYADEGTISLPIQAGLLLQPLACLAWRAVSPLLHPALQRAGHTAERWAGAARRY